MIKCFLSIITIFCCSISYANQQEEAKWLSAKVILQNSNGYFALSDGSCWKAISFQKRWRTLSEWWNSVELAPGNYECMPNDWHLGAQIEIYSKYGNLEVREADASNQEELRRCTHLLVNPQTGYVLFAIALGPEDCIIELFNDAYREGYQSGYSEGSVDGYQNGYDIGYSDSYYAP